MTTDIIVNPDQPPWIEDVLGPIVKDGDGNQIEPRTAALVFAGCTVEYDETANVRVVTPPGASATNLPALGPINTIVCSDGVNPVYSYMTAALHGNLVGGTLHAVATTSTPGFMSSADKATINAFTAASLLTSNSEPSLPNSRRLVVGADPNGYGPGGLRLDDSAIDGVVTLDAPFAAPVAIGTANNIGNSLFYAQSNHVHALTFSVVQTVLAGATGNVSLNNNSLVNIAAPVNPNDATNKAYVDALVQGLDIKASVTAVSTTNIASLSGLATTVDSILLSADGKRVLLAGQTTASQNGIWVVHSGAWTRPTDMAAGSDGAGNFVFVEQGTNFGDSGWVCTSDSGSAVVGTNSLAWTQFSGAGQITAGAGLTKTGNTINVIANADGSIVVNADDVKVGVISDAQHGTRGGGTLHSVATNAGAGFAPALPGSGVALLGTTNGTSMTWLSNIGAAYISSCAWSTLTGVPANINTGTGTSGTFAIFTGASTIGNSANLTEVSNTVYASGHLRVTGEVQSLFNNTFRTVIGNYGVFWRLDGSTFVLRSTASGDQYGSWSSNLPIMYTMATGDIQFGNSTLTVQQSTSRVGINRASPQTALDISGALCQVEMGSVQAFISDAHLTQAYDGRILVRQKADYGSCTVVPKAYEQSTTFTPRKERYYGGFSLTGNAANKALTFSTAIHGVSCPTSTTYGRSIVGKFLIGWLGNGHLTNGGAQLFLFSLGITSSGAIQTFFSGNATAGAHIDLLTSQSAPTIATSSTSNTFTFTISCPQSAASDINRFYWEVDYGWAASS